MGMPPIRLFFDYVDPASYLLDHLLGTLEKEGVHGGVVLCPLEVRPPPSPILPADQEPWKRLHEEMEALATELGIPFRHPSFIPWSRKAHELAFHAREKGCFPPVHRALFGAHFVGGSDIGRVDVLTELAASAGLDRTEVKTVLDIDRFKGSVLKSRNDAREANVVGVPTLLDGDRRLEGFPGLEPIRSFLQGSAG